MSGERSHREAAVDLLILYGTQGLHTMIHDGCPDDREKQLKLAARLEWALQTAGVTLGEIRESHIRLEAAIESTRLEDELEALFNLGSDEPPAGGPS